jgi:phosphoenolpyruvate carboxylase
MLLRRPRALSQLRTTFRSFGAVDLPTKPDTELRLRQDIKTLGRTLGSIIKYEDEGVYDKVETLRALGRQWREQDGEASEASFNLLVNKVKGYNAEQLRNVARAFSHFLALSNSAENQHRLRRLRGLLVESGSDMPFAPSKEDTCAGSASSIIFR